MKRIGLASLILLGLIGITAVVARNRLARSFVQWEVHRTTGFSVQIESFYWDLRGGWISARGITINNPPDFAERTFARVHELYVELDWASLVSRHPHIKNLMLNIDDLRFVKHTDGTSNATRLRGVDSPEDRSRRKLQIDNLRLILSTVHVKDYNRLISRDLEYRVNLDRRFQNVTELTAINRLVLHTILKRIPLDLGLTLDKLAEGLELILGFPTGILNEAAGIVEKASKAIINSLRQ